MIKFAVAYTSTIAKGLYFIRPTGSKFGNATMDVAEAALFDTPEEAASYDYAGGWASGGAVLFVVAVLMPIKIPTLLRWEVSK